MKSNNFQKVYNDFLKEKIKEYCNKNGCYEIYWDYRESLEPNNLMEAYTKFKDCGYEKIEDYIENELLDYNFEYDNNLFAMIGTELKKEDFYTEEFEKWYQENCNIYEDLQDNGYNGIDVNLSDLLRNSVFYFNIMFATEEERNSDMNNIITAFGSYHLPDFEYMKSESFDNSLTYLIHQQGHTCKEYFDTLNRNPSGYKMDYKCEFIESIVDETVNCSAECMSELTILVKMNGKDAIDFLNYLANKNNNLNLIFDKDSEIGMFNEWIGSGGLLGIALEKDFIVPKNMIRGFQIEGAKNQNYTVDEVFGLVGSCWRECMNYTEESPCLMLENIEETIRYAQYINKEVEEVI